MKLALDQVVATKQRGEKSGFLYHMVPADMRGHILKPLNILRDTQPDLFALKVVKYNDREHIMDRFIPTLKGLWNDVLHLTSVHPTDIKVALEDAGLEPRERKFYQVDPALLNPQQTTVYLYSDNFTEDEQMDPDNFAEYDPSVIQQYSVLSEKTKRYYRTMFEMGKKPLLFVGVPHILYKGEIDVSKFPIITA